MFYCNFKTFDNPTGTIPRRAVPIPLPPVVDGRIWHKHGNGFYLYEEVMEIAELLGISPDVLQEPYSSCTYSATLVGRAHNGLGISYEKIGVAMARVFPEKARELADAIGVSTPNKV